MQALIEQFNRVVNLYHRIIADHILQCFLQGSFDLWTAMISFPTSLDRSTFSLGFALDNSTNKVKNKMLMLLLIIHLVLGCFISRKPVVPSLSICILRWSLLHILDDFWVISMLIVQQISKYHYNSIIFLNSSSTIYIVYYV